MKKLLRVLAAALFGLSLATGAVAAQTGTIDTTGPESENVIEFENESEVDLDNDTDVTADVQTDQEAGSGNARTDWNTTGGDATSGDADNESDVEADVEVDNTSATAMAFGEGDCGCEGEASIENTGPYSVNEVIFNNSSDIDVDNDTDVDFDSDTDQSAWTGNAVVSGNTTGGNATSGSASNSSSTVFSLSVSN